MIFNVSLGEKKGVSETCNLNGFQYKSAFCLSEDPSLEPSSSSQNSPSIAASNYQRTSISGLPSAYKWPGVTTVPSQERISYDLAGLTNINSIEYNPYLQTSDLTTSKFSGEGPYFKTTTRQEDSKKSLQGNSIISSRMTMLYRNTGFIDLIGWLDLCPYSQTTLKGEEDGIRK